MTVELLILWTLVGYCPPWPPWPWPRGPWPPPPPPHPWSFKAVTIIGAIIGGWTFTQIWPAGDTLTGVAAAATAVGAYVGGALSADVYLLAIRQWDARVSLGQQN
jgi:hypothetical protein